MMHTRWAFVAAMVVLALGSQALAAPAEAPPVPPSASPSSASPSGGASSAETPSPEAALLQVSDRITDEAERQHQVNQRMDVAVDRFAAIVLDLQSNDLLRQANGPQLERFLQVLKILSGKNVPDAAKYLEEARKALAVLKPNLISAGKEITIIVAELERLLKNDPGQEDELLRELEQIIQDEKKTHQDTKDWGRQLLENPDAAEKPRREIANTQDRLSKRTDAFMEHLKTARDGEGDLIRKDSMTKAYAVLDTNKVPKVLSRAGTSIEEKKPVAATNDQADAIRWLEEAAKLLRPDEQATDYQNMKELREKLENILKEQTELREKTEKVPAEKFEEQKKDLQVKQREIEKKTDEAKQEVPQAASPEVKQNVEKAQQEMQKAEQQMDANKQQATVENQKEAEKALQEAIKQLDKDIEKQEQAWEQQNQPAQTLAEMAQKAHDLAEKQKELRQETSQTPQEKTPHLEKPEQNLQQQAQDLNKELPMKEFREAAQEMKEAAQDLQQAKPHEAQEHQKNAEQALEHAAERLEKAQQAMELAAQQQQLMQQTAQTQQLQQLAPQEMQLQQQTEKAEFKDAAEEMKEAAHDLEQGQREEAKQHEKAAIEDLVHAAEHELGQPEQHPPEPGQPEPIQMPHKAMPLVQIPQPKEQGERDFGRGGAAGKTNPRGDDRWKILGDRERDSLYQKYARQLPPEYRELLGDYYEALSKDAPRVKPKAAAGTEGKP